MKKSWTKAQQKTIKKFCCLKMQLWVLQVQTHEKQVLNESLSLFILKSIEKVFQNVHNVATSVLNYYGGEKQVLFLMWSAMMQVLCSPMCQADY